MLPVMKPAILVALLFRTLDAFRVFDNIFVLTSGANETSSVSMLAYNNLLRGLNLGIGSTMSVLIFITVAIIAFVFVKLFGTAAPGSDDQERRWYGCRQPPHRAKLRWGLLDVRRRGLRATSRCSGSRRCRSRRRPPSPTASSSPESGRWTTTGRSSTPTSSSGR